MSAQQVALIEKIREMKQKKNLTYQQIVDACVAAGEPVCMNTVRKIMTAPMPEAEKCLSVNVQAVARAVIGNAYDPDTVPREDLDALQSLLAAREEIDRERQQGILDRTAQIERMQHTIDEQQDEIKRKSHTIKIMILWAAIVTVLLICVTAGLIFYLILDIMHPDIGMIRR